MKAKPSKKVAGIIIRSRKSIAKDGVVTVSTNEKRQFPHESRESGPGSGLRALVHVSFAQN